MLSCLNSASRKRDFQRGLQGCSGDEGPVGRDGQASVVEPDSREKRKSYKSRMGVDLEERDPGRPGSPRQN